MDELRKVMKHNGFEEFNRGKTSGSAICFYNKSDGRKWNVHKPHPSNVVPRYLIDEALEVLRKGGQNE